METLENNSHYNTIDNCSGAFSYYGYAWRKMWKYFLELLLVTIVSFIVTLPTWGLWNNEADLPFEHSVSIDLLFFSFEGVAAYLFLGLVF